MKAHALLVAIALCASAQTAGSQASLIAGQVTKVDKSAGKITIKHGPIKKLGMDQGNDHGLQGPGPRYAQGGEGRRQNQFRCR